MSKRQQRKRHIPKIASRKAAKAMDNRVAKLNRVFVRRGFSSPGFDQGKPSEFDAARLEAHGGASSGKRSDKT